MLSYLEDICLVKLADQYLQHQQLNPQEQTKKSKASLGKKVMYGALAVGGVAAAYKSIKHRNAIRTYLKDKITKKVVMPVMPDRSGSKHNPSSLTRTIAKQNFKRQRISSKNKHDNLDAAEKLHKFNI